MNRVIKDSSFFQSQHGQKPPNDERLCCSLIIHVRKFQTGECIRKSDKVGSETESSQLVHLDIAIIVFT